MQKLLPCLEGDGGGLPVINIGPLRGVGQGSLEPSTTPLSSSNTSGTSNSNCHLQYLNLTPTQFYAERNIDCHVI